MDDEDRLECLKNEASGCLQVADRLEANDSRILGIATVANAYATLALVELLESMTKELKGGGRSLVVTVVT